MIKLTPLIGRIPDQITADHNDFGLIKKTSMEITMIR
jgi:hypothetical protein